METLNTERGEVGKTKLNYSSQLINAAVSGANVVKFKMMNLISDDFEKLGE